MKTTRFPSPIIGLALAGAHAISMAADMPKEGRIDATECFVVEGPRVESSSGIVFGSIVTHSVGVANKRSGSPFDDYGTYCIGHYVESKAGPSYADAICEQTDADGDKWLTRLHDEGNRMAGRFEFIGGTGKYVGARISGEFRPAGPLFFGSPGHAQRCLIVTGTYRLK